MTSRPRKGPLAAGITFGALLLLGFSGPPGSAQTGTDQSPVIETDPRGEESRASQAFYFDWISSQYEGSTEAQTLAQMDFFQWLFDEYGMRLDIYSLDVGNIDDGPYTAGVGRLIPDHYGSPDSESFRRQFPNGFRPLADKASGFGARLGIWLGPDGFGQTPGEERARVDMLAGFCRDFDFKLFKFDAVAGPLRPEKQEAFIRAMEECRAITPDLIVLNERVELGRAARCATTDLWEGVETYIDVFSWNPGTAPHHRAGALARELPPGLTRRLEDHGVCLSSCLDFWEDDLVLQAFNRASVLAPEIYGHPWLLRDEEFPRLARLVNLHRRFRGILAQGKRLPEERYGPHAVSRGDSETRFLTLRNLSWAPVFYRVRLDESIGLSGSGRVEVRRFHPAERILGRFPMGSEVEVEVPPFRSCLLLASTAGCPEVGVDGCDYRVVRDTAGRPALLDLLAPAGSRVRLRLAPGSNIFSRAELEGKPLPGLLEGSAVEAVFPGSPQPAEWHRKLCGLKTVPVPDDAEALYEATCFAADSNALEVRSLERSGPSRIPQVRRARRVFFEKPMFVNRGIWDRNLFDGDMHTFFIARLPGRALRIDFGQSLVLDRLVIKMREKSEHDLNPDLHRFEEDSLAEVSADLENWVPVGSWSGKGTVAIARIPDSRAWRYVRIHGAPRRIAEIVGYRAGEELDRSAWRASNLFYSYRSRPAEAAWSGRIELDRIPPGGYLAVALDGFHGNEGAWAALRVAGKPVGAPDRAVSFPSNTWEYFNVERESGYTYFFPLDPTAAGRPIEVVVLSLEGGAGDFRPTVYLTAAEPPREKLRLTLHR
jgi:hypothetical protein